MSWIRRNRRKAVVIGLLCVAGIAVYASQSQSNQGNPEAQKPPALPSVENKEDATPQAVQDSKKVAESFARGISEMDANHPDDYIQKIKPWTSPGLFRQLSGQRRPLLGEIKRTVVGLKSFPVDSPDPGHKEWNVIVTVQTTKKGGETKEEISYWLLLVNDNGTWKVQGVDLGESPE